MTLNFDPVSMVNLGVVAQQDKFMKHKCPRWQQSQNLAKYSSPIHVVLPLPNPNGHMMSLTCEQPVDELTLYFVHCTLARRLSSKLLKQGYLVERFKSSFRKFYGQYGDLIQQYEVSLSRMLNDFLTLDQQWLPNQSDFPPISWPWCRLSPSPNYEWFPWSICNRCGMPAGNAYPSGHLVPSPILGLANTPILETKFLELAISLLDFSPRIPLGTFSILLYFEYFETTKI